MTPPLVTVAISVHNAGRWLRPSVQSVLAQTYERLEIFVVDDGSTDGCLDTIADLEDARLHRLSQPNQGKAVALNLVLDHCTGDFLMIHDADDVSHPERVEAQVATFDQQPDLACCLTQHEVIVGDRRFAGRYRALDPEQCDAMIQQLKLPANDPTAMFRLSLVGDLRFDPELRIGQGNDFILRVAEQHPMQVLGRPLYSYRVSGNSNTRRDAERTLEYVVLVRRKAYVRRGLDPAMADSDLPRLRRRAGQHAYVAHVIEATIDARFARDRGLALRTAWPLLRLQSASVAGYKPLAYALAPMALIRRKRPDRAARPTPASSTFAPAAYVSWTPYFGRSQSFIDSLGLEGIYVHYLQEHRLVLAPVKYGPMFVSTVRRLLRTRPKVVFVMDPPVFATTAVHLYCRLTGARYVMDCHSGVIESWKWRWLTRLQRFHARRAVAVIVTNPAHEQIVRGWGASVHVVGDPPLQIPGDDPNAAVLSSNAFSGLGEAEPFVFVLNRFHPDEAVPDVIDAARRSPDTRFVVSGDLAKARPEWLDGVPDNLRFTGWLTVEELWAVARRATVLLVLTTQDNTILRGGWEAMYLGKPLVTSASDALRSYFTKGTVFVPNSGAGIAAGIAEAIADEQDLGAAMAAFREEKYAVWEEDRARLEHALGVRFPRPGTG